MRSDSTAMTRACASLAQQIERARGSGSLRLPVVAVLARTAHVSQATMVKAIHRFRERGMLVTSHGRGTRVVASHSLRSLGVSPGGGRKKHLWRRIAERIERDLVLGAQAHDRLPSVKELSERYGVSAQTVRRSLSSLVHAGVLSSCRRSHAVRQIRVACARNTIVLIARGDPSGRSVSESTPRTRDHLRFLEDECTRRGITLAIVTCNRFGRRLDDLARPAWVLPSTINRGTVLGLLLWADAIEQQPFEEILQALVRSGPPVCVLDDDGQRIASPLARGLLRRGVHAVMYGETPGRRVGRYLAAAGHRGIAYITAQTHSAWSILRRRGLSTVIDCGGGPEQLREFGLPPGTLTDPVLGDALNQARGLNRVLPSPLRIPEQRFPSLPVHHARFVQHLHAYMSGIELSRHMVPVFERALAWAEASAWVCATDTVASAALDFLRARNVLVPRHISVVGLDDTPEASAVRLTSYNFNARAAVGYMMESLLRSRGRQGSSLESPFEPEGFVNERTTSAPVGSLPP